MINRKELREKALAATPGAWIHDCGNHQIETESDRIQIVDEVTNSARIDDVKYRFSDDSEVLSDLRDSYNDMEYIASANPSVILALLDQLEAYEEVLKSIAYQDDPKSWGDGMSFDAKKVLAKYSGQSC